jgi:hypothetical protein
VVWRVESGKCCYSDIEMDYGFGPFTTNHQDKVIRWNNFIPNLEPSMLRSISDTLPQSYCSCRHR